jgi:hypothetical protein
MNVQVLLPILNMILALIPSITDSKIINQTVAWLLQIEPIIIQFSKDLGPVIQNIVAAFAANPATTATQMAALKVLDGKVDQAFDDAFTAYLANHPDPVAAAIPVATPAASPSVSVSGAVGFVPAGAATDPLPLAG